MKLKMDKNGRVRVSGRTGAALLGVLILCAAVLLVFLAWRAEDAGQSMGELVMGYLEEGGLLSGLTKKEAGRLSETVSVTMEELAAGAQEEKLTVNMLRDTLRSEIKKLNYGLSDEQVEELTNRCVSFYDSYYGRPVTEEDRAEAVKALEESIARLQKEAGKDISQGMDGILEELAGLKEDVEAAGKALEDYKKNAGGDIEADGGDLKQFADGLAGMEARIGVAQDEIGRLLAELKKKQAENENLTEERLRNVRETLNTTNDRLSSSYQNLENLIGDFRKESGLHNEEERAQTQQQLTAVGEELRNSLGTVQEKLRVQIEGVNGSAESLKERMEKMQQQLHNLQSGVQDAGGSLQESLNSLTGRLESQETSMEEALARLEEQTARIREEAGENLAKVFQSVSSGKEIVASTLTDRDMPTEPDAAFRVIAEHIAALADKRYQNGYNAGYTDGFANTAHGKITYVKHSHSDACYTVCGAELEHWSKDCPVHAGDTNPKDNGTDYFTRCPACGFYIQEWDNQYHAGSTPFYYEVSCTQTIRSCGRSEGEIISATIEFE